jgi:hypothetical protein
VGTSDFPASRRETRIFGNKFKKGPIMNAFRLGGVVVGLAFLAGSGSDAFGQFVAGPVGMSMPMPVCGGCAMPVNLNPVNLNVPTLSPSTLNTSLSVPTVVVPPPPPPAVEVRAYPVVVDDRDRNRNNQHDETPIQLDVSATATPSSCGNSGSMSTPTEPQNFSAAKSADPPSNVAVPAPWYSVGDWSFGTWVMVLFVGFIAVASGKR